MTIWDIDTPALLVDADLLGANIARMANLARGGGKLLRPHAKTHKCAEIARLQLAAGACGLTVAKLAEAETFAEAGIEDIFVANQIIGDAKLSRATDLARRCRLTVGVDSVNGARALDRAARAAGLALSVRIEVDTGLGRAGVRTVDNLRELVSELRTMVSIAVSGLYTHEGHLYRIGSSDAAAECSRVAAKMRDAAAAVCEVLGRPIVVSVGSTPGAAHMVGESAIHEMRPGNYVFHDTNQVELGANPADCSLSVLATVVSCPTPTEMVLDAGTKSLAGDRSATAARHGWLTDRPNGVIDWASEEHAHVTVEDGGAQAIGSKVRVTPYHACPCVNLHDWIWVHRGETIVDRWPIVARGKIT